jgi:hypothetical protein
VLQTKIFQAIVLRKQLHSTSPSMIDDMGLEMLKQII